MQQLHNAARKPFVKTVLFILSRRDKAAGCNLFINKFKASDKAMDSFVAGKMSLLGMGNLK